MANGRNLRSRDDVKKDSNKILFNFDNVNTLIYRNQKIEIKSKTSYDNIYKHFGDHETPTGIDKQSHIETCNDLTHRKSKQKVDVLADSIFDLFHRKMKKEEKSMANLDRNRILSEVDNLNTLLQNLNQYDWIRHLPDITHINDSRNFEELEIKKDLTIKEIQRILDKFDNWKKRQEKLATDIREYDDLSNAVEEDEFELPIEYLRQKRLKERRLQNGPVIRLNLRNGYALVIDPLESPKIVQVNISHYPKVTKKPKADGSDVHPIESFNRISNFRRKSLDSILLESTNLNLKFDEQNNIAFGNAIPDIKRVQAFSLNPSWKLHAREWRVAREKLRNKVCKSKK